MTELIIFDCDGTLVDSELLYNTVISELLCQAGLTQYTPEACLALFTGMTFTDIRALAEQKHNMDLSEHLTSELYVEASFQGLNEDLKTVEGAESLLKFCKERHKICVGSNGERASVIKSLKVTGLYDYFGGHDNHIFTKVQVENPKPAPDLFLYAAAQMGCAPENTIVVEDSVSGVKAGVAAGMSVFGFTGSSHEPKAHAETLRAAGAHLCFEKLIHICEHLQEEKRFAS